MEVSEQLAVLTAKIDTQGTEFQKNLDTLKAENEELRKRLAGTPPEPDKTPLTKGDLEALSTTSRKAVEKQATELKEAREQIAKISTERAIDQEQSRIEKKYPNISDEARPFAEMLLTFEPESGDRKRIEKMLEINNLKIGDVTTPLGSDARGDQGTDGDAFAQLTVKAHEIQKSNADVSDGEALDMAFKQNSELAATYHREER